MSIRAVGFVATQTDVSKQSNFRSMFMLLDYNLYKCGKGPEHQHLELFVTLAWKNGSSGVTTAPANPASGGAAFYCGEHFLKLVLNCCVLGPKLLRASVN